MSAYIKFYKLLYRERKRKRKAKNRDSFSAKINNPFDPPRFLFFSTINKLDSTRSLTQLSSSISQLTTQLPISTGFFFPADIGIGQAEFVWSSMSINNPGEEENY
ncbi:hypothetical protein H5410_038161 [Solanum commersonii]|uniref:Uncharacterized protein n=1 Tax=Solanum commersonii TaxID=4109 RepID=A0A9J5Y9A8_SOLCO|nr:hypothetical protein H5410_038161 [Solanum commersonii]